jgi:hypothetical protein
MKGRRFANARKKSQSEIDSQAAETYWSPCPREAAVVEAIMTTKMTVMPIFKKRRSKKDCNPGHHV